MEQIKFYKDSNSLWHLNGNVYPAGSAVLILFSDGKINLQNMNGSYILETAVLPTEILKENDTAYADVAEILTSCKNFFSMSSVEIGQIETNTDGLETLIASTNTKLDELKTIEGFGATATKQDALKSAVDLLATATKQEDIKTLLGTINNSVLSGGGTQFKSFAVEITRPANTTVYSANDVVADVSAAFIQFANVAKANGAGVKITRVRIQTEDTGVAGKKFNLHLYNQAPTFIADNAAFAVSYANATKRIGAIPVVMGTGNLGTVGMNDYDHAITNPIARDIYWILETVDGFTPSANSTKFTLVIDCELSN